MNKNYKLTIAYDGSRFFGWERQPGRDTIQGKLETVLAKLTGAPADVIGAGRTDAGVHARAMVASVRLDTDLSPEEIRDYLNRYLPDAIAVREVKEAGERFHARYNALGKTYRYTCFDGPVKPVFDRKYVTMLDFRPDLERMQRAAALLTGENDFMSFCGNPRMKKSTVRRAFCRTWCVSSWGRCWRSAAAAGSRSTSSTCSPPATVSSPVRPPRRRDCV